jgi:hypothetical protein
VDFHEFLVSPPPMAEDIAIPRRWAGDIYGQRR